MSTTTVGTIELIAKIDTGNYKKGAKEIDDANKQMGESTSNADNKLVSLGKKGFKVAAVGAFGLATAIAGMTIKGGISRALNIEDAQAKLKGLGHDAQSVEDIMKSALASVKGTAYGLDSAATLAATAVAAGVKPGKELTKYLSLAGDAATIAGVSLDEMGSIFGKVQTQQKAYTMELNQLADRGIPIYQWLQDELGVSQEALRKMVAAGKVDSATYFKVIKKNIGGAALESGSTTRGAYQNLLAALSRIGQRIVQGPIDNIRTGFGDMTRWIDENADTIVNIVQTIMTTTVRVVGTIVTVLSRLMPVIAAGATGWLAYRAAVSAVNAVQTVQAMLAAATATKYVLLNGSLVAVRTSTVAQTIAQGALNTVMKANPIALVISAVTSLGVGLASLVLSSRKTEDATRRTANMYVTAAVEANKYRLATDKLKDAQLNAEQAALNLELAEKASSEATRQHGSKSIEARQAALDLKRAKQELDAANKELETSEKDSKDALMSSIRANDSLKTSARETAVPSIDKMTGAWRRNSMAMSSASSWMDKIDGRSIHYSITGKDYSPKPGEGRGYGVMAPQRYKGGPVSAGRSYLVGENRDGSINDTTELFIPNQSGRIINSTDLQEAIGGVGGSSIEYNIANINISSDVDGDRWLRRLTNNTEIESSGLVPTQKYAW